MKSYFFGDLLLPNSAKAYDASSADFFFFVKKGMNDMLSAPIRIF